MKIDVHQHLIPPAFLETVRDNPGALGATFEKDRVRLAAGPTYALTPSLTDPERRLRELDEAGIDLGLISIPPWLFGYAYPPEVAHRNCTIANDGLVTVAAGHPDRLVVMGHLPLQDVDWAIGELERRTFRAVQIGSNVNGRNMDDPALLPFFRVAERMGVLVFVHPSTANIVGTDRLGSYYLTNLLGYVTDTALAAASLMFGGVLDACPDLKLCLAHGGGSAPILWGRWEHGQRVRREITVNTTTPVSILKKRLYYDTLTHSPSALQFLIQEVGVDRILMGTDLPLDMGNLDQAAMLESLGLSAEDNQLILGGTSAELLGLGS